MISFRLNADLKSDMPPIYEDIALMRRVLEDLLESALGNAPKGGCIDISVGFESSKAIVKASDSGRWMPKNDVLWIFEHFYQQHVVSVAFPWTGSRLLDRGCSGSA